MPLPKALLESGVTDMVRISDARMSGTGYGTCVLHVAPEAAVGGPIALVRTGDLIHLDAENRQLDLLVDEATFLAKGLAIFKGPLMDNKGKTVITAGTERGQKDPELEKMDYLVEGVIGATS